MKCRLARQRAHPFAFLSAQPSPRVSDLCFPVQQHGQVQGGCAPNDEGTSSTNETVGRRGGGGGGDRDSASDGLPAGFTRQQAVMTASTYLALQRAMAKAAGAGNAATTRHRMPQQQSAGVMPNSTEMAASPGGMSAAAVAHQDTQLPLQQGSLSGNLPPHPRGFPCCGSQLQQGPSHYVPRVFPDSSLNIAAPGHAGAEMPMRPHLTLEEWQQQQLEHHHHLYHHQLYDRNQQLQQLQHLQQLQQRLLAGEGSAGVISAPPGRTGMYHSNFSAWQQQQPQPFVGLQNMAPGLSGVGLPPQVAEAPGRSGMMPFPPGGAAIGARAAPPSQAPVVRLAGGMIGPWPSAPDWPHHLVDASKQIGMSHVQAGFQPPPSHRPHSFAPPVAMDDYQRMLSVVGASFLVQHYGHHCQQQRQAAVVAAGVSVPPPECPEEGQPPPSSPAIATGPSSGGQSSGGGGGSGGVSKLESLANACMREL